MTEEEFSVLSTDKKWHHIKEVMEYIQKTDDMYKLRRRYNPHHPKKDIEQENHSVRVNQYQRWIHIKNLYATHRDELVNTLDNSDYQQCKLIMERIFTQELDDVLKSIINE